MKKLIIYLSFFLTLIACQPIEKVNHIVFDNSQLAHFNILSTSIDIDEIFEKKISDPYIGHTLKVNPSERIINWINENFKPIGNENIFNVTILDASITQTQFENKDAKNFDEKNNWHLYCTNKRATTFKERLVNLNGNSIHVKESNKILCSFVKDDFTFKKKDKGSTVVELKFVNDVSKKLQNY